jgi:hypothetical protein
MNNMLSKSANRTDYMMNNESLVAGAPAPINEFTQKLDPEDEPMGAEPEIDLCDPTTPDEWHLKCRWAELVADDDGRDPADAYFEVLDSVSRLPKSKRRRVNVAGTRIMGQWSEAEHERSPGSDYYINVTVMCSDVRAALGRPLRNRDQD